MRIGATRDATGWRDIDLTLVPGPDGRLKAKSAERSASLAPRAEGIVAAVDTPAGTIGLRHPQAAPAPAVAEAARASYKGALGGRDLLIDLTVDGFEETVVLADARAGNTYLDEFVLPAGVSARTTDAGVEFVDAKGAVIAMFSNGVAYDAAPRRAAVPVTVRVVPNASPATAPTTTAPSATTTTTVAGASTSSSVPPSTTTSAPSTTTTAPERAENVVTVEVSVDRAWLSDRARVFPVAIDPTFTTVATNAADAYGIDTFGWQSAPITNYGTATALYVGNLSGGATQSFIKFNHLAVTPSPDLWVTESHLMLLGGAANDCSKKVDIHGIDGTLSPATVWNNRPATDGPLVSSTALAANCASIWNTFDTTSLARRWVTDGAPNHGLRVAAADESDPAGFKWFWSGNTANPPLLYITYQRLPGLSTPVAPAAGAVVATATPTLSAATTADPDADQTVKYWFRATPAPDAESGAKVVDSGWRTATEQPCATGQVCYTAPVGALADGVTFHSHVWTSDGLGWRPPQGTPFSFRVDLGLGDQGAHPRDQMGPATVNLASGNAVVRTASPSFPTVNGEVGLAYTYNSQAPAAVGLTGSYFDDPGTHVFPATPAMVRADPTIDHYWGSAGPGLGLSPTNFLVRWTGTVTVPTPGDYLFAADHDDGMRIWVGGVKILDTWSDGAVSNPSEVANQVVNFASGSPTKPIVVEYYQAGGAAFATVSVKAPGAAGATQLPPSWLGPDTAIDSPVLPRGWSVAPGHLRYASAVLGDRWVAFADTSGSADVYTWTGSGYAPPPGEDGVVGADASGALTLHVDGVDYVFDRFGRLIGATSALDDADAAGVSSPTYQWTGTKPRLATISDGPGGRAITLRYNRSGTTCPARAGFDALPPVDMLCQVDYWDGTATKLFYSSGRLARIEDPGGQPTAADSPPIVDFAYGGPSNRMSSLRSALAADAVAATALTGRSDDASVRTEIVYDGAPTPRVSSVTLPAPTTAPTRPRRTYVYDSATQTSVNVDGLSQPHGFGRRVSFARNAAGGLTVVDTDADNVATTTVYDAGERPTSTVAGANRKTTFLYDGDASRIHTTGRLTESFGPATGTCLGADNRPNGTCTGPPVARSATTYDTDPAGTALSGLAATYWPNRNLAERPVNHGPALPAASGSLIAADPPAAGLGEAWSARYSGEVALDATSTAASPHRFSVVLTGRARLFVDDRLVVDAWSDHASAATVTGTFINAAAGRHRFRVDYATQAGVAPRLELRWTLPGGSDVALPAAKLAPRYSNPTRAVTDDTTAGATSRLNDVAYLGMANRLVTEATADRDGAKIVTKLAYEDPGQGYLRPRSRTLGAGAGSTTTYAYYGANEEPLPGPCAGAAANQGRALKASTGADPDGDGLQAPIVRQFTYDAAGRVVGSAVAGNWTCSAYDARGRVTSVSIPAYGGEPARTFAYNYAVGANPLVSSAAEATATVTTKIDLLGRVAYYFDVWANPAQSATGTSYTYDQPGRLTDTSGPVGAFNVGYSPGGRVVSQSLNGAAMASAPLASAYDRGELIAASYPTTLNGGNGTSLAVGRNVAGMVSRLTWKAGTTTFADDEVTRSQAGRVVDQKIDAVDADAANPNFEYDSLGRLTKARVLNGTTLQTLDYGFGGPSGCAAGAAADPGRNTNRTSVAINAGTPTTYCYDHADRLISSTDAAVGTPAYDSHGNTTTLGTQTLIYDGADRHMETKVNGATVVRYQRDVTGRITARTEGTTTVRYGYAGPGDSPAYVMDASNNVIERTIGLVGGAMVTKRGGLLGVGDVWSYPNVHGDVMATTDQTGVKQGTTRTYDPFGQALAGLPDNSAGNFDYGWLGQHQRPIEHAGGLATIEMGARQYVPSLGRFLEVDPVEGGSANDYDYGAGDPVSNYDLDGTRCVTGVARRVQEERVNSKTGNVETKTREICRSVARGAKRTAKAIADDPGKYFTQCLRGFATGAVYGVYVGGLAGAGVNGARECFSNVIAQALVDGGVDKEFVAWANGISTFYAGATKFAEGTTQIVEFRGPFYP